MRDYIEDTIVAIGTKPGEAAIGIVKLSGNKSIEIADRIFKSNNGKKISGIGTYTMIYGKIEDKLNNIVDEAILSIMKAPGSYTREDVRPHRSTLSAEQLSPTADNSVADSSLALLV